MAQRTTAEERMTRTALAAYLTQLATEFDDAGAEFDDADALDHDGDTDSEADANPIAVDVGNKSVTLTPPETIDVAIDVTERTSKLRGKRETITLELTWKP